MIAVLSSNDPFVLSGWSRILGFQDKVSSRRAYYQWPKLT